MAEPEVTGLVLLQDRGADRAVEERHRRLGGYAGDGGHDRHREAPPDDRRHGEQVHDRTGQSGQAARQHVAHRGRYARRRGPVERRPLRREQPRDLLGEKRIARRTVVHGLDQLCWRALTAYLFQQLANLVRSQAGELYQLGLPGQLGQQQAGGMIAGRQLHVPVRRDDQHGRVM